MIFYKYVGGGIAESNTIGCRTVIDPGIKVLEDLRLKITPPNEFNDPFELTPCSKFTLTIDGMLNILKTNPEWFRQVYELMVEHEGYPYNFNRLLADLPTEIPRRFNVFKRLWRKAQSRADLGSPHDASQYLAILCVSKLNNSIAMWSYYANHHRGIALGLDLSHPCFRRGLQTEFRPVKYVKNRGSVNPRLPYGRESSKQFISLIFIKSTIWRHEEEYRRVYRLDELLHSPAGPDGKRHYFLNIDGGAIREVIFGCCIDLGYEQQIRAELKRRPKTFGHVKLLRCQRHRTRFEMQVVAA